MVTEDKLELVSIISELSKVRKLFHSETDFQLALAWEIQEIHKKHRDVKVRLEKKMLTSQNADKDDKNLYIDIYVEFKGKKYGVELKYKTKKLGVVIDDESYNLREQNAQDFARYYYLKDVSRLEEFKEKKQIDIGCAVFLTNDNLYWSDGKKKDPYDKDFRINEGRIIGKEAKLRWRHKDPKSGEFGPSKNTVKQGAGKDINIKQEYYCKWQQYSELEEANNNNIFKYILLII